MLMLATADTRNIVTIYYGVLLYSRTPHPHQNIMAIYNISTKIGYEIPKSTWITGNYRDNLTVKPEPQSGFLLCADNFSLPLTGQPPQDHTCKTVIVPDGTGRISYGPQVPLLFRLLLEPDSLNGTNFTKDVMVYNFMQITE